MNSYSCVSIKDFKLFINGYLRMMRYMPWLILIGLCNMPLFFYYSFSYEILVDAPKFINT